MLKSCNNLTLEHKCNLLSWKEIPINFALENINTMVTWDLATQPYITATMLLDFSSYHASDGS